MQVEAMKVASLSEDAANARKHSERNVEAIVASLRRFGQQKPIVVDSTNVVRAGNGTLAAAKQLGWETIQVVRTDLTASELTAYAIADNRTGELASWHSDVLAATLDALRGEDAEILDAVSFTEAELLSLLEPDLPDPTPHGEPELQSEHLIEIRCDAAALAQITATLEQWREQFSDIAIDVS